MSRRPSGTYTETSAPADAVARGVAMARLAHRFDVAQCVGAASGDVVNFPFTTQYHVASPTVMGAGDHCAFTTATCSPIDFVSQGH